MLRPGPRPRGGSPRGLRPCSDRDPPGFCVKNAVFPRAEPACGPLRPAAPRAAPALCGRPPCHLRAFATPALPAAPLGCPSVTATTLPPFIDSATTRTISSDKTKNAHVCAQNATLTPMLPSSQRTLGYFRGGVWYVHTSHTYADLEMRTESPRADPEICLPRALGVTTLQVSLPHSRMPASSLRPGACVGQCSWF